MDDKNIAVITYIDKNFEGNLERDFLYTLRRIALFKGKICVLNYGISDSVKKRIVRDYQVEIYDFEKTMAVFSLRYQHLPEVIDHLGEDITNVMIIDGGDIWFQKPIAQIFEETKDKIGCVEELPVFGQDDWTNKCLFNLGQASIDQILEVANGRHVKNSGMVCGPKQEVKNLLKKIYIDIMDSGIEYFGIDQIYFNYEWCQLEKDKAIILNPDYNFVLVTHKEDFYIKDMVAYYNNHQLITVVHNAGGNWRLIKKQYGNEAVDREQYVIENVRRILVTEA